MRTLLGRDGGGGGVHPGFDETSRTVDAIPVRWLPLREAV